MKKYLLLVLGIPFVTITCFSQTDSYWKAYGNIDNISDSFNWFGGNPNSGKNLYFNNTGVFAGYGSSGYYGKSKSCNLQCY